MNFGIGFILKAESNTLLETKLPGTKGIELESNFPELVYFLRGVAKNELQDYQGAIDDFSKVIEIDPHNKDALLQRSIGYKKLSNLDLNKIKE